MSRNYKILILTIAIIISLLGGAVGGILVRSYFLNTPFDIPLFGQINIGSDYQYGNLIITQPKKVVVEQDVRVEGVIKEARKSMVSFYHQKSVDQENEQDKNLDLKKYYWAKDKIGEGLVLTNDGWLITNSKIDKPVNFIAIDYENEIMEVEEVIFDKTTKYYFIKVGARNLTAVRFAEKVTDGQILVTVNQDNNKLIYVKDSNYEQKKNTVKSSEKLYGSIKIDDSSLSQGDLVFNLGGEVIGLHNKDDLIQPISHFLPVFSRVLNNKELFRPVLGINYLELYNLIGEEELEGVLITKDTGGIAVVWKSPAAETGLVEGDIVLEVDGVKINEDNNLSGLVQSREPGDEIELTILRDGERESVKMVLGDDK